MKKTFNVQFSAMIVGLALAVQIGVVQAKEVIVYGKIDLAGDYINNGGTTDYTMSSSSSRIGFKGERILSEDFTAIWKIESNIDVSGERGDLKARNRYLGLKHNSGTLIVGYHDTPFKLLGKKVGVMSNTIAERRSILGVGGGVKMDTRGKNGVMLVSPKMGGVVLRAMRTAGDDKDSTLDEKPLTSLSATYKHKKGYIGIAYENQKKLDASGIRVGAGVNLGKTKINAIYETLSSDSDKTFDRAAYGGSVTHRMGKTTLKAQAFMVGAYKDTDNSGAMLYAVGVDHELGKKFTIYTVLAAVNNDENGVYPMAGSGHGEKYKPAVAGDDLKGVSVGMVFKF